MMAVKIEVSDNGSPVALAIGKAVRSVELRRVIGRSIVQVFQNHLRAQDAAHPNALGGTRTHFYASAARGTHFDVVEDGVIIGVESVGFAQRVVGGTITATKSKYLTIPARAESYGKRASEFNDLVVVFGRGGQPVALARALQTSLRVARPSARVVGSSRFSSAGEQGGEILFWLEKSVTQAGDPSLVPQPFDIAAGAFSGVNTYLDFVVAKARQQSGGNS